MYKPLVCPMTDVLEANMIAFSLYTTPPVPNRRNLPANPRIARHKKPQTAASNPRTRRCTLFPKYHQRSSRPFPPPRNKQPRPNALNPWRS